jgi:DNA polymerase sigma
LKTDVTTSDRHEWWIVPTSEAKYVRLIVVRRFRNALSPNAILVCHGWTVTDTYLASGNIDLVVLDQSGDTILLLIDLQRYFKSLEVFQMSEVIDRVRVPIIKGVE